MLLQSKCGRASTHKSVTSTPIAAAEPKRIVVLLAKNLKGYLKRKGPPRAFWLEDFRASDRGCRI